MDGSRRAGQEQAGLEAGKAGPEQWGSEAARIAAMLAAGWHVRKVGM